MAKEILTVTAAGKAAISEQKLVSWRGSVQWSATVKLTKPEISLIEERVSKNGKPYKCLPLTKDFLIFINISEVKEGNYELVVHRKDGVDTFSLRDL